MGKFDWMSNPQYLAQVGHFLGGAWVVFLAGLFGGSTALFWAFGIGTLVAGFKEFVFDTASWGESDSWSDSFMDWMFYELGGGAAMLVFWLAETTHRLV